MKFVQLSATGLKTRPVWVNPAAVVSVTTDFAGGTEIITMHSADKGRITVSEKAEDVVRLLEAAAAP